MKKRKDGRYARQITIGIKDGKPVKKTVYGKTIKEVNENYEALKRKIETGISLDLQTATVSQLMDEWYKTRIFPNTKTNTHHRYEYFFKRVEPLLGEMKVSEVKKFHIEEALTILKERGNASAAETLQLLNKFFNYCIEHDVIYKNPCMGLSVGYTPKEKRRLTKEELDKLETADLLNKDRAFILVLRYTGMRIGEMCALKVDDVNFDDMTIRINKTIVQNHGVFIQDNTKTKAGERIVPILLPLYRVLKEYVDRLPSDQEFLFLSNANKVHSNTGAGHLFRRILRNCGIEDNDITAHYLRHTFISECYDAGIDVKKVQYWVGHSDIKTTLDVYTHLSDENKIDGTQMNNFYGSQTEVKKNKTNWNIS